MQKIKVRLTFLEDVLGTANSDKEIHSEFIASKAPDAPSRAEEIAAIGANEVERKEMTVFPRDTDGTPLIWDYQVKGFFKDSCKALRKVEGTECSKITAFKQEIDGLVFVFPRAIRVEMAGDITSCQRPLRAQTPQGERIALANSESIPAGSKIEFEVQCFKNKDMPMIKECLEYGQYRGLGQWRNSGKGKFTVEYLNEEKGEFKL